MKSDFRFSLQDMVTLTILRLNTAILFGAVTEWKAGGGRDECGIDVFDTVTQEDGH